MFNYLFASYYQIFLKTKDHTPVYASVCMMALIFIGWFFVGVILLRKYNVYDMFPTSTTGGKIFCIILFLSILFILNRFYRKNVTRILEVYNEKSAFLRGLWTYLSIILLIIPYVLCAELLTK